MLNKGLDLALLAECAKRFPRENPKRAATFYLRQKYDQDYIDFLDCHPGRGGHMLALNDLRDYHRGEYDEAEHYLSVRDLRP